MSSSNLPTFYKKDTMKNKIDTKEYIFLSKDTQLGKGNKSYSFVLHTTKKLGKILEKNDNYYEMLPPEFPVKLYFDLEMEYEGLTFEQSREKLFLFINWIMKEISILYEISLEKKISLFLIVVEKINCLTT